MERRRFADHVLEAVTLVDLLPQRFIFLLEFAVA